jgi:2-methylcitrate dehydratase
MTADIKSAERLEPDAVLVAIPLLFGRLTARDYEDEVANDPKVDALRARMEVKENQTFTREYYAADKRYIGNALQVIFKDGSVSERVAVDYPIGHRKRRAKGIPLLVNKFASSVIAHFGSQQAQTIISLCAARTALETIWVDDFVAQLVS